MWTLTSLAVAKFPVRIAALTSTRIGRFAVKRPEANSVFVSKCSVPQTMVEVVAPGVVFEVSEALTMLLLARVNIVPLSAGRQRTQGRRRCANHLSIINDELGAVVHLQNVGDVGSAINTGLVPTDARELPEADSWNIFFGRLGSYS